MHAHLARMGRSEVLAINDQEALDAAMELTRLEGIIPALESAHAVGVFGKKPFEPDDIVVLCLSGRGDKDMETYMEYNDNKVAILH
jgi:tryptophan synthase beta chain